MTQIQNRMVMKKRTKGVIASVAKQSPEIATSLTLLAMTFLCYRIVCFVFSLIFGIWFLEFYLKLVCSFPFSFRMARVSWGVAGSRSSSLRILAIFVTISALLLANSPFPR